MIPAAVTPPATDPRGLDEAVARLRDHARAWARASLREKADLARALLAGTDATAERMVRAACLAKGLPLDQPAAGDEWLAGVYPVLRIFRQLADSLDALARRGNTPVGRLGETDDGRVTARVFPASGLDRLLYPMIGGEVHFLEGVGAKDVEERRGRFHKAPDHDGKVCLVLGAGNVNSIAPADVATKLFVEGKVCVLKMNPVNAYAGPDPRGGPRPRDREGGPRHRLRREGRGRLPRPAPRRRRGPPHRLDRHPRRDRVGAARPGAGRADGAGRAPPSQGDHAASSATSRRSSSPPAPGTCGPSPSRRRASPGW